MIPLVLGVKLKFSVGLNAVGLIKVFLFTKVILSLVMFVIKSVVLKFSKILES